MVVILKVIYIRERVSYINVTVRIDFVLNLSAVLTEHPTYTLPVTPKMSKSPDSFTFTVGKLGMCTLSDLSWLSVTRLYQTQEWLYVARKWIR
jgi:hypothetical protein